ncbi:MAG: TM2 domain protein [Methanomassiliicoccales archaeon PtaU1.Bin124]|nr:MAG: TM2 domain protein [Methanomassiliicoccales archaeon PtaU1.Bin124]
MSGYKSCPKCGRQNPVDAQWCASCGANIANIAQQQGYQQAPPNYGQPQYQQPPVYNQAPGYGAPPQPYMPMKQKSEGLAVILSFFIPGLGQMYNGKIGRGLGILISAIILSLLFWLLVPLLILFVLWIWNIYDAYKGAQKYNQQQMMTANYQQYPRY